MSPVMIIINWTDFYINFYKKYAEMLNCKNYLLVRVRGCVAELLMLTYYV